MPHEQDAYQGFSLQSVCWGYRDIFRTTIESLFEQGLIGKGREEVSRRFFDLLKQADQGCFDHVLKEFLGAINPRSRWILDVPAVFADVVDLGRELAGSRLTDGITYFRLLGEGGFGDTPEKVRCLMNYLRRLRQDDRELALAFLKGYRRLDERLAPGEMETYLDAGLRIFAGNRRQGLHFMEGTSRSSENIIRSITHECRLDDVQASLASLLKALVGYEVHVSDLGSLDSDELAERGSSMVCMAAWLFVPEVIRRFETPRANRSWYLLVAVVAAGMLSGKSFCRIHGHPRYRTCADLVGTDTLALNALQILEFERILTTIRNKWPGARRLLDRGIAAEFERQPPSAAPADALLRACLSGNGSSGSAAGLVHRLAARSVNVFDTAALLDRRTRRALLRAWPGLDSAPLGTYGFLPDFLYRGEVSAPPADSLVADMKNQAARRRTGQGAEDKRRGATDGQRTARGKSTAETATGAAAAGYLYDEWSQPEKDYRRGYCLVRELRPQQRQDAALPPRVADEARLVRRAFERLKPDLAHREKYLAEGDRINSDLLVDYLVLRRRQPAPKVRFYEKPLARRRDLAVLVLMDVSGSTSEEEGTGKVIDLEKEAAFVFGEGLHALDDRFAICGFSGQGRERCEYHVYKDFDEAWGPRTMGWLAAARPSNATRIGAALRHSGYRLSRLPNRRRLIILITDGKPMDADYDPATRYAQYDVRKACEENERMDINTFAISTAENSRADMDIMFPRRRFVILADIRRLPRVLPALYARITV